MVYSTRSIHQVFRAEGQRQVSDFSFIVLLCYSRDRTEVYEDRNEVQKDRSEVQETETSFDEEPEKEKLEDYSVESF
jgi:hypothetical protein